MSLPHADLDPRLTIRADLVAAGQRRIAARRRRRGATLTAVVVTGLLGTAAATAKIEGSGTGVPVLDEVLAISAERQPPAPSRDRDGRIVGPPPFDVRPGPGSASQPLELPWAPRDTDRTGIAVAYVNRSGHICIVLAGPNRRPDSGGYGCTMPKLFAHWLRDAPAFVTGAGGKHPMSVKGFARADVVALRFEAPNGPVEAALGKPWEPDVGSTGPLRPFVATFELDPRASGPWGAMRATRGNLTATLADGRVVEIPRR
jgi:hypothetical protein